MCTITIEIIMHHRFFLDSMLSPIPESGLFYLLNMFNPFVGVLRDFVVLGRPYNLDLFPITSLIGVSLFLFSCKVLYSVELRIKDYL